MTSPLASIRAMASALPRTAARVVLFLGLPLALPSSAAAAGASPFADAVAVWHMADQHDSAGADSALTRSGEATLGIALEGKEREESLRRGGDGRVADFRSGWLSAGQGVEGELNLSGAALTLCARLRDPSGKWNTPLFSKHGGHPPAKLQSLRNNPAGTDVSRL